MRDTRMTLMFRPEEWRKNDLIDVVALVNEWKNENELQQIGFHLDRWGENSDLILGELE